MAKKIKLSSRYTWKSSELEALIDDVKNAIKGAVSLDEIRELKAELSFYEDELAYGDTMDAHVEHALRENGGIVDLDEFLAEYAC